jgi:uncharacterized protein
MKFVCDVMLGKLSKYLRVLGLDAPYIKSPSMLDSYKTLGEPYYFLTRRKQTAYPESVILVTSNVPIEQAIEIREVVRRYVDPGKIMNRCIGCNIELVDATKSDVEPHVPEFVFHQYESFKRCPACKKVYWEGSHAAHMSGLIKKILQNDT